mmetsp:Transcript_18418/g.35591  ORF Transcript_18418/g.35591 Transcript_18418/m.35591 type:complete len:370 (-) Transcript_18418:446-1555(-)
MASKSRLPSATNGTSFSRRANAGARPRASRGAAAGAASRSLIHACSASASAGTRPSSSIWRSSRRLPDATLSRSEDAAPTTREEPVKRLCGLARARRRSASTSASSSPPVADECATLRLARLYCSSSLNMSHNWAIGAFSCCRVAAIQETSLPSASTVLTSLAKQRLCPALSAAIMSRTSCAAVSCTLSFSCCSSSSTSRSHSPGGTGDAPPTMHQKCFSDGVSSLASWQRMVSAGRISAGEVAADASLSTARTLSSTPPATNGWAQCCLTDPNATSRASPSAPQSLCASPSSASSRKSCPSSSLFAQPSENGNRKHHCAEFTATRLVARKSMASSSSPAWSSPCWVRALSFNSAWTASASTPGRLRRR